MDREAYKQKRKETKVVAERIKAEEYNKWERNKGKSKMTTDLFKIAKQMKKDRQDQWWIQDYGPGLSKFQKFRPKLAILSNITIHFTT